MISPRSIAIHIILIYIAAMHKSVQDTNRLRRLVDTLPGCHHQVIRPVQQEPLRLAGGAQREDVVVEGDAVVLEEILCENAELLEVGDKLLGARAERVPYRV